MEMVFCNETPFIFRINEDGHGPTLLLQVCLERGWRLYDENSVENEHWNLWWKTKGFPVYNFNNLAHDQFINHIPKGFLICRKDNMTRYFKCMKKMYGSIYNFSPESYIMPQDYKKFICKCKTATNGNHLINSKYDTNDIWICKPVAQSKGRGIFIFQTPNELVCNTNAIVQRYVKNPLLIAGYKFDLRLYVLVPSFHPLTVYAYREGLARFGTEKFNLNNLTNTFAHLTNTSLNKYGPRYRETKERIGSGCKWSLQQLRCYLQQTVGSDWLLWQDISVLITLTIAGYLSKIPHSVNCFEFYGFDILIDSEMKPWLLEVNLSPALGNDCIIDPAVKKPMLHDMFDLLGLPVSHTGLLLFSFPSTQRSNIAKSTGTFSKRKYKLNSSVEYQNHKGYSKLDEKRKNKNQIQRIELIKEFKLQNLRKNKFDTNYIWGNGIDWNNPKPCEGNWVRIFPILPKKFVTKTKPSASNDYDLQISIDISSVNKYLQIAKTTYSSNQKTAGDDTLNELMRPHLIPNSIIWLPPI